MTTEVIIPFEKDTEGLREALTWSGLRLVNDFTKDAWPGEVGGVWQIEGSAEELEQFVQLYSDRIAYC